MPDLRDELEKAISPRFSIIRELGGGGMSRVFLARETELDREVVIKVLPPETAGLNLARFRRETQMAAKLHHPHIVPLHTSGDAAGVLYYVPGEADVSFMTTIDRTFGKDVTTRTWDTVGRIVKAARA